MSLPSYLVVGHQGVVQFSNDSAGDAALDALRHRRRPLHDMGPWPEQSLLGSAKSMLEVRRPDCVFCHRIISLHADRHRAGCPLLPSQRALEWMASLAEAEEQDGFFRTMTPISNYKNATSLLAGLQARLRHLEPTTIRLPANKAAVEVAIDALLEGQETP